jgi:hypothetical protein
MGGAYNKDLETASPIVTVLASAAPARTRVDLHIKLNKPV